MKSGFLPIDDFAFGLGLGNELPSSTMHSADILKASLIMKRADRKVFPWLQTPGKSTSWTTNHPSDSLKNAA